MILLLAQLATVLLAGPAAASPQLGLLTRRSVGWAPAATRVCPATTRGPNRLSARLEEPP